MQLKSNHNERLLYCNDRTPTNRKNSSYSLESVKDTWFVYIFVARKSEVLLCAQYQPVIQETLGIVSMEKSESSHSFELLMQTFPKGKFHINHWRISRISLCQSVYRQWHTTHWDQYHDFRINFIVCGSVYSMMKKNIRRPQRATIRTPYRPNFSASIHHHRYQRDSGRPCNSHRKICFACICWQVE